MYVSESSSIACIMSKVICTRNLVLPFFVRINIHFNVEWQARGSDTSTAESGSEADDATSPKALRSYISHPKLTPVREEVSISSILAAIV